MAQKLDRIKKPIMGEMERYEKLLNDILHSDTAPAQTMLTYILETRGKGIRPIMVLLIAAMYNGGTPLPKESLVAAMLVEMTHTASLVHDDIIDEADMRRGKPSVKAKWPTPLAVLIGDYTLAKTYTYGLDNGYYPLTTYIAHVMTQLCEGEIIQSDQSDRLEMTREIYDDIIFRKTASLIGRSCGAGAMSAGAGQEEIDKMYSFGRALGMAFQIKDDILDYSPVSETGKEACSDIRERKINLPLLCVLENSDVKEKERLLNILSTANENQDAVKELYETVIERGGLETASAEVGKYLEQARTIIRSYPESPYRDSLELLCDYLGERQH